MPTDLPPDYKPAPPRDGDAADSRDPGATPMPGGPATPGDLGGDVVTGPGGAVPQPGPPTGADLPGGPGGDVVNPGLPGIAPAI